MLSTPPCPHLLLGSAYNTYLKDPVDQIIPHALAQVQSTPLYPQLCDCSGYVDTEKT